MKLKKKKDILNSNITTVLYYYINVGVKIIVKHT